MKTSPFLFDFGRIFTLLRSPNFGRDMLSGPDDDIFPAEGYILLKNAVDKQSCQEIIEDYERFEEFRKTKSCAIKDNNNRNYRLTNFHLVSNKLLLVGLNKQIHEITGKFFKGPPLVYTSLYFKHGSQQRPHIDTPFFWTSPMNMFCGVWLALENISSDAGPLIYYPGSQKYFSDQSRLKYYFNKSGYDVQKMFELMEVDVRSSIRPEFAEIEAGDIFLWHPGLMHGGSQANNPSLTRHSVVFHFAPVGVNVRAEKYFLKPFFNFPKYGIIRKNGLFYARGGLPRVMI